MGIVLVIYMAGALIAGGMSLVSTNPLLGFGVCLVLLCLLFSIPENQESGGVRDET